MSVGAYERLIVKLFSARWEEPFKPLPEAGEHVFFQPILDSYGGSLHRVFTIHHTPLEVMGRFSPALLADPDLKVRIARIWEVYKGQKGAWGMVSPYLKTDRALQTFAVLTNLTGYSKRDYEDEIIPQYAEIAKRLRLRPGKLLVGSYDSFLDLNLAGTREAFAQFVENDASELRISLYGDDLAVERVAVERNFAAGVLSSHLGPSEPVYLIDRDEDVLREFEQLLRRRASEYQLERFLSAHYKLIFGPQYDRIETQLWLRFPELDIAKKTRRLDVFLRNSINHDWELLELKRSVIHLTGSYRDVPVLSKVVTNALQQVRNYGRLLKQDAIKRQLVRIIHEGSV